jgi:hypothetical protein
MVLRRSGDHSAGALVALLLILTAWGNALAMLIVSGLSLVVGLFISRGRIGRGVPFVVLAACIVATAIAIVRLAFRS